jgi:hypothetical protein
MSDPQQSFDDGQSAAEKVSLPGTFLIIVGALNLLVACLPLFVGVMVLMVPAAELAKDPSSRDLLQKGFTPDQIKLLAAGVYLVGGAAALITAIITIVAGLKMRALQSYALVVIGCLLTVIPCLSPAGCCGLGEGIGIWALIVLMNPEVKSAFR